MMKTMIFRVKRVNCEDSVKKSDLGKLHPRAVGGTPCGCDNKAQLGVAHPVRSGVQRNLGNAPPCEWWHPRADAMTSTNPDMHYQCSCSCHPTPETHARAMIGTPVQDRRPVDSADVIKVWCNVMKK
ncbi:hypothetical protein HanIR_Chr01g0029771 [Helianthus annuus]|nr:hypothetical protein HanIR_Chr01g0029771 [Helianthus annuus]